MAVNDGDRVSTAKLLETLKGLQASRHLGSEPEVDPQTNEKTKHTIKQDYLPNADWNVNDPDADGYVENRTHWVSEGLVDITPEHDGDPQSVMADAYFAPYYGKIYGYSWEAGAGGGAGEWYPDFEAVETNSSGADMWLLAMDGEGNQITDYETAVSNSTNMIACIDSETMLGKTGYIVATRTPKTVKMFGTVVHKLDRKFYDYTEPFDPTGYTKDSDISIQTISQDYGSSQGHFTHSYDFVKLPNGRAYGNITLHVDSWDDTTKTGTFSTLGTPLANPGSMIGGTAYVNGGIVFFTVEADGSNPRISNPIPSDLLVVNRAVMRIPQMFLRKEDE